MFFYLKILCNKVNIDVFQFKDNVPTFINKLINFEFTVLTPPYFIIHCEFHLYLALLSL